MTDDAAPPKAAANEESRIAPARYGPCQAWEQLETGDVSCCRAEATHLVLPSLLRYCRDHMEKRKSPVDSPLINYRLLHDAMAERVYTFAEYATLIAYSLNGENSDVASTVSTSKTTSDKEAHQVSNPSTLSANS